MEKKPVPLAQLHKIPGKGMPIADKEKYIKDLSKLTRVELQEVKDREGKLLAEKAWLQRLPDKGKRIQDFYDKVSAELARRVCIDDAATMFSQMNIAAKGQTAMNHLEWSGRFNDLTDEDPSADVLDSDDEIEMDPLRVLAQRTMHDRQTRELPPEPQLITADDLAEIKSFAADASDSGIQSTETSLSAISGESHPTAAEESHFVDAEFVSVTVTDKLSALNQTIQKLQASAKKTVSSTGAPMDDSSQPAAPAAVDQHARYLIEKTESSAGAATNQREKFKPYQTTVSNVHDPAKERQRKQGKHWEVTAATPPPIQHSGTKMLTLMDSVEIQTNYLAKLRALQEKQAAERLTARLERLKLRKLELLSEDVLRTKPAFRSYRLPPATNYVEGTANGEDDDDDDYELEDEEMPNGGFISYTVYDY